MKRTAPQANAYHLATRVLSVGGVSCLAIATATRIDSPRNSVITRQHQCDTAHVAETLREHLAEEVTKAVAAIGGSIVSVEVK